MHTKELFTGKKFKGNRKLEDVIQSAKNEGWEVDTTGYDTGDDGIWLRDLSNRIMQVYYNTFNGHFIVYTPASESPKATHLSKEFDNEEWYKELLELFYF